MAWVAFGSVILIIVVVIATAQRSLPREGGGGADDADGGLGTRPPNSPVDGGGPVEPAWWPEFERELARYTAQQERAKREPVAGR
jgi:hypothetical protein